MVLSDFGEDFRIEIRCEKCDRRGSYRVGSLMARIGNMALPDVLSDVSSDCPRRERQYFGDRCGAIFGNLPS